jgi:hypothetical protein
MQKLKKSGKEITFFMEYPHNILLLLLHGSGYDKKQAAKIAPAFSANDPNNHILAKEIIARNMSNNKARGATLLLQTAIQLDIKIVFADAAWDSSDIKTLDLAYPQTYKIAVGMGLEHQKIKIKSPHGIKVRNKYLCETVQQYEGIKQLSAGSAHLFGRSHESGTSYYKDSLSSAFKESSTVMVDMFHYRIPAPDYTGVRHNQAHLFVSPLNIYKEDNPLSQILSHNGLDPAIYNPRVFFEEYRNVFNTHIKKVTPNPFQNLHQPK